MAKSKTTFEPGDEPRRCCAKSKTTQDRCRQPIVPGRRVCRYHGGNSPGGTIIHGRYSAGLGRFRDAYQDALQDPSLLDLRESLALLDITVQKAAERVSDCDTPKFREVAVDLYEKATRGAATEEGAQALNELGDLLRLGMSEDSALDQLAKAAERMARRQEKAWQIKLDAATAINARDLVAVMARWADIVLDEVPKDAATRVIRRIDAEVLGSGAAAIGLQAGDPA